MTVSSARAHCASGPGGRTGLAACVTLAILAGHATAATAAGAPSPGAISARTLKLPDGPGSVRGLADHPQVNLFMGQVEYEVPIELPKAQAQLTPKLALSYQGALGNGPLGVGWSLPSISIRRSLRLGVPSYTDSDELELLGLEVGGRLIAVGDGTYRVLGQGQTVKVETAGDGFIVYTPDGTRFELGRAPAARLESDERIASWWVERIVTQSGGEIVYDYEHRDGQLYPTTIRWGGDGVHAAELVYEDRADRVVSYRTGFRVETSRRVASIVVRSFGVVTKTYALGYDEVLPLSRLASVAMTGRGGTDALPTLSFEYAATAPQPLSPVSGADDWVLNQTGVSIADIDGDGLNDMVMLHEDGYQYRRNLGGRFAPYPRDVAGGPEVGMSRIQLMDLTGNSRPELVVVEGGEWTAYRLENEAWASIGTWENTADVPLRGSGIDLADVNGDGRTDSIRGYADGLLVRFNGDGALADSVALPPIDAANPSVRPGAAGIRFGDVNGDGLADVMWLASEWMTIYLGRGDGTFAEHVTQAYPWHSLGIDVDLDDVRFPDLNRDGLADCVWFTAGHARWYRGKANNTFEDTFAEFAPPADAPDDVVVAISDINGNGSDDLLWSWGDGLAMLDLAGPTTAGMLVAVHNGMGKSVRIEYAPSAILALFDEVLATPWIESLPMSIPVPVRVVADAGGSEPARVSEYKPRDGFWDGQERRFGGFLHGVRIDLGSDDASTLREETDYVRGDGNDRVLRGRPSEVRSYDGAGRLLNATRSSWMALAIDGLPDVPLLRRAVETERIQSHYEGTSTPVHTLLRFEYDGAGNAVVEHRDGRLDVTGDESRIERTYASDDTTWVRDKVIEETLLDAAGTAVSTRRLYYGDSEAEYAHGSVGKGWLRRASELLVAQTPDQSDRWVDRKTIAYDAHGNAVATYEDGALHAVTFDERGMYPLAERTVGDDDREFHWSMTWDEPLGVPLALTDPAGVTTQVTYDGLARPTSIAIAGFHPHTRHVYDWSAPNPTTYSFKYDGEFDDLAVALGAQPPTDGFREIVTVANGMGEELYTATRLTDARFIVGEFKTRDERGQVAFVANAFFADGALPTAVPEHVTGQSLSHDALGRIVAQTLPDGQGRTFSYGPLERTLSMPGLADVVYMLDHNDRIAATTRTIDGVTETIEATYDPAGRVTLLSAQQGAAVHEFSYDTLGRLVRASDPDIGVRAFVHDDNDRVIEQVNGAGDVITYVYDAAGRVVSQTAGDDTITYHYDEPAPWSAAERTAGRLAWVQEPQGTIELSYDELGRVERTRRSVGGSSIEQTSSISPSGLVRSINYDDGFGYTVDYDRAGRAVGVPGVWTLHEQDAGGRVLLEEFGNGVVQMTARDVMGLQERITVARGTESLYDVMVGRNAVNALSVALDFDGVGLDHSAVFEYDGGARLTRAVIGANEVSPYEFQYQYDALQNMTARVGMGPTALDMPSGIYNYGESGAGPRQLTSVQTFTGDVVTMAYDGAGRQVSSGESTYEYNGFDQLTRALTPAGTVDHSYGYDGNRVLTRAAGTEEIWFNEWTRQSDGMRDHYVAVGDRVVARVRLGASPVAPADDSAVGFSAPVRTACAIGSLLVGLALLGFALASAARRRSWRPAIAGLVSLALVPMGCAPGAGNTQSARRAVWTPTSTVYFHQGFGPGPVVLTDETGAVHAERRHSPYGAPIDSYRELGSGGSEHGEIDYGRESTNSLNKHTEKVTGLSFHGARWMAPATGRWLTPDPPVKAPDAEFMARPWDLNPYQYVRSNPVTYWDPDGNEPLPKPYKWNKPGNQPGSLYVGIEAHMMIANAYTAAHYGDDVVTNYVPFSAIFDKLGVDPYWCDTDVLDDSALLLKPDILNLTTGEIYEIKPATDLQGARKQLNQYVTIMNAAGVSVTKGSSTAAGVAGVVPGPAGYFVYWSPEPGIILYEYRKIMAPRFRPVKVRARATAKSSSKGFWGTLGTLAAIGAYAVWKSKGCAAGPGGCVVGWVLVP